ncbi:carbohydrate-binding protein [Micromonospora robiginosa]|uniref:Chitin-binding type-3 domain-containing protein n=1 Tax=Micromonospora robiginosa TaxID=2749844 RepID=A0AAF0SUE9_9ACTN|nr:carbohydrate-binding protein [Micromonospora ferruginea]WMF04524.1 hypothetical protein H1D33_30180 [Micromonospora ferruginea]
MRLGRPMTALLGGVALLAATVALPATAGATPTGNQAALVACDAPAWAEGVTWTAGSRATFGGRLYQALVTHTPPVGAGWTPAAVPALWTDLGACTGGTPSPSPTTRPPSPTPSPSPPARPDPPRRRRRPPHPARPHPAATPAR